MKRSKTVTVGELLDEFFQRPYVAAKVAEGRLRDTWREIVGPAADAETTELRLENGETELIYTDGVFVAIGLAPDTKIAQGVAETDKYGYIISDERCLTAGNGVFVAGDCRTKSIRQIVTAASDGATAALAAIAYIEGR